MVFKLLGRVSALDARFSRVRINLISLSVIAMGLLAAGLLTGVTEVKEAVANPAPRPVSIADIVNGRVPTGTLVTVTGRVDPRLSLEIGRRSKSGKGELTVDSRLTAIVDDQGDGSFAGMFASVPYTRDSKVVTLTGMVRALPAEGRRAMEREGAIPGLKLDVHHTLAAGQRPDVGMGLFLAGSCGVVLGLILVVRVKRHLIFRAHKPGEDASTSMITTNEPIDLRISGRLRLSGSARRFVEVQAQPVLTETGDLIFFASIDASAFFMGFKVKDRSGEWSLVVPASAVTAPRCGEISFAGEVRPAVQLTVTRDGRRPEKATLSFGTADQRARFLRYLDASRFTGRRAA